MWKNSKVSNDISKIENISMLHLGFKCLWRECKSKLYFESAFGIGERGPSVLGMVSNPLACERRRISGCYLVLPKITSANQSQETISVT